MRLLAAAFGDGVTALFTPDIDAVVELALNAPVELRATLPAAVPEGEGGNAEEIWTPAERQSLEVNAWTAVSIDLSISNRLSCFSSGPNT